MRPRLLALVSLVIGCNGSPSDFELEISSIGGLEYAVPTGWVSHDRSEHQTKIIVWSPVDNPRKESITLMRTKEMPALVKSDFARTQQFLADAQQALPAAKFGSAVRFQTKRGLLGARVEGELVPDVTDAGTYRRMHAVVIDGSSLVHVLYTARDARPGAFARVLDTLIRKDT